MLPELLISKLRILYLHSRRRYLINSIPLLSIVALLVGFGISTCLLNTFGMFGLFNWFNGKCSAAASTSLTIDGGSSKSITGTIAPNETKYVSSNVTYSANDVQDYAIKISYANGSNSLKLDGGSTTINGVVDNTTGSNISNAWGYSWADGDTTESSYANLPYSSIPISGTKNVETGTTINSTTKKMIFAANLSDSNPTGHYKANVLLSLVATPATTTYTITYDANGGSGAPASTTCVAQGAAGTSCATMLSSSKPTRTNYAFLGWADTNTATTKQYDAGGSITVNSNKTIYAVWKDNRTIGQITTMQDMNSDICANSSTGTTYNLRDTRDGNSYNIRKLSDGHCWMTQNLRLVGSRILTTADSDVIDNYNLVQSNIVGFNKGNNPSSYTYDDSLLEAVYYSGDTNYGTYYSGCAATAGTCSEGDVAIGSVCPRGWQLPSVEDFEYLRNHVSRADLKNTSLYNFGIYNGYVQIQFTYDEGRIGHWWTKDIYRTPEAFYLKYFSMYNDDVNMTISVYAGYNGFAVRCIAQ